MAAVALLATAALLPRAPRAERAASRAKSRAHTAELATHGVAARAETTAAKLVSPPRTSKMVLAEVDESQLTN
jgi:hypothetical protein